MAPEAANQRGRPTGRPPALSRTELVKKSAQTGRSIRELVLEQGLMTDEELDRALDVLGMTRGG